MTLQFPATTRGPHRLPPLTVNANVVGNVFVAQINRLGAYGDTFPTKMIWRAANGRVIKTVPAPGG